MTARKLRLGFVGIGWWSNTLAEAALKSSRIEIAACHSRSGEKRADFAKKYGASNHDSFEGLLADPGVDAVVLTTPHSAHADQAVAAAEAGKHVLVEKPMALSVADCRRMIAAAENACVTLAVGHNHRRMARYRLAKEFIERGALGEIILAEGSHSTNSGNRLTPQNWRWKRSESPGGPLTSTTIHHAENFGYLIGPVRRVTSFSRKVRGELEADDVFAAALEFECGALGYLGGSFITQNFNALQIHGTDGVFRAEHDGGAAYFKEKGESEMARLPLPDGATQRLDSHAEQMDAFARCALEGERPEVGGKEGAAAVAVMEAIVRSSESGAPAEVEKI